MSTRVSRRTTTSRHQKNYRHSSQRTAIPVTWLQRGRDFRVLKIAEVIVTLEIDLPENGRTLTRTIYTSKEERDIAYLIETDDWLS